VPSNGALYGIIGALGAVVIGGGLYIARQEGAFAPVAPPAPASTQPVSPAPVSPAPVAQAPTLPAPRPPSAAPAPPAAPPGASTARDNRRIDSLLADARAAMARHDHAMANRLIDQAAQIDPRDRAVQQARADLAAAQQQSDRDNRRVDLLLAQARAAIARHDYALADRLLDQAENIDVRDREVQQARAELNAAQRPPNPGRR
jgi:hypothetical protein